MWPTETPYANNNPRYINNTHSVNINPATYPEVLTGYSDDWWRAMKGIFTIQYDLPFGLTAKGTYQYAFTSNVVDEFEYTYDAYTYDAVNDKYNVTGGNQNPWRRKIRQNIENRFGNFQLNYNKKFGDHTVGAVAAYERSDNKAEFTDVGSLPQNNTVSLIYFADQNRYGNTYNEEARAGYIGRINYNYKQKYIIEALGRYDGSYLYKEGSRYGLFPGVSAGWRISEEDFMNGGVGRHFSELKLRASYGETGSEIGFANGDAPTPFSFLQGYNYANRSAVFNGVLTTGVVPRGLPITTLTWVTNINKNIGIDFGLLNNKLTGTFDIFERKREGMPAQQNDLLLPIEVGYTYPNQNLESDAIRGVEGVLTYSNSGRSGFTYSVSLNGTLARLRILDRYNPRFSHSQDEWRNSQVDRWANTNFGYHVIGRFQTQEEIDKYPVNNDGQGNRTQLPGDLIFEDFNNDGIINGLDQQVIGYAQGAQPYASFGLNTNFGYKGITVALDLAGANLQTYYREFEAQIPFQNNGAGVGYLISDAWRRTDPFDANSAWIPGKYPAVRKDVPNHVNYANRNDFWMTNVKYLRIRNLQVGYNIPKRFLDRFGVAGLRVYAQGSNLLSIDNMREFDLDPEVSSTNGLQYPQQRIYIFGFNLNL
jgi:TonB-linked SusC/RagA family outer membrane protein